MERVGRLESIAALSPADETVLSWQYSRGESVGTTGRSDHDGEISEDVLIRVLAHDRVGFYRVATTELSDLEGGVRAALADACDPRGRENHHIGAPDTDAHPPSLAGWDRDLAELDHATAARWLEGLGSRDRRVILEWSMVGRAVVHSAAATRWAAATAATVRARNPPHSGGAVTASARRLAELDQGAVAERLDELAVEARENPSGGHSGSVLLSGEAAAQLLGVLAIHAFSMRAYSHGRSFLRDLLQEQIFDRQISIVDDGSSPDGLPFPIDLEGRSKRRIELVERGIARTPAVRASLAPELGLPATPHLWAADDSRPEHLFIEAGSRSRAELVGEAGEGLWISSFSSIECVDPRRMRVRAVAAGVRRLSGGRFVAALPRMVWETSLLHAWGQVAGVGSERTRIADPTSHIGSLVAPPLLLADVVGLRPS